jgi:hypothetical protein
MKDDEIFKFYFEASSTIVQNDMRKRNKKNQFYLNIKYTFYF